MQDLITLVKGLPPQKQRALAVLLKQKGINLFDVVPIAHWVATERESLSYAQRRLWFLWQLEPQSAAYHIPVVLKLRGRVDLGALQRAFDALAARHETLRTVFVAHGDRATQHVQAPAAVAIEHTAAPLREEDVDTWLRAEIGRPFDLEKGPLLRVKLRPLAKAHDEQLLVLVMHHIVSDGWSMQVIVEELVALYEGYRSGKTVQLAALPIQYADYASWQRNWMEAGERERQLSYWLQKLGGEQPVLELPLDHPRPAEQSYRGAQVELALTPQLSAGLMQLAQREGTTLFMLLLAAFQVLLHRYSGQRDIRVGVPVANRNRVETEKLIGFFVNTQVLKADVDSQSSFQALLQQVKQTVLDAQAHQDLPFEQLVEALQPERSLSHNPLFQVMVNHQIETPDRAEIVLPGLRIQALAWEVQSAQFDLTLDLYEIPERIHATFTYATDLFEPSTITQLAAHYQILLEGIVAEAARRISDLPLLAADEQRAQLAAWTERPYPLAGGYARLFERQVDLTPERAVASCLDEVWSYAELDARANRVGHALVAAGVAPDQPVALLAERGLPLLGMMIGGFKAGAGYLALDPNLPDARLLDILRSARVPALLCSEALAARAAELVAGLPAAYEPALSVWEDIQTGEHASDRLGIEVGAKHLAYVIYTSGSTGKPKGVWVEQAGMLNNQLSKIPYLGLGEHDVIAQTATQSFDISVWQFLTAPLCGARVDIVPNAIAHDPQALQTHVRERQISVLESVPALIQGMLEEPAVSLGRLRWLLPTGEAMPLEAARRWLARYPDIGLVNAYGPAECSDDVTLYRVDQVPASGAWLAIGPATDNNQVYVLGEDLQLLPAGVVGELYVAGVGVGRGYLGEPARTAEVFLPNPFAETGGRLYRTGDLARYRADGVLEYAGRSDHQVKIRGFRIELGEIEARLLERAEVREAVVVAQDGPVGKQLVGYVVPARSDAVEHSLRAQLRAALKACLPDYMVPAHLMVISQLPLTPNGKLDRAALPKPDASVWQKAYVEPRTQLEQQIAGIWADVLKLPRVGLDDNFFEVGGDSIVSIQLVSRARQLGIRFTPKDLFQHQTVRSLAAVAERGGEGFSIDQGPVTGALPLMPIQRAFFAQDIPERQHWNQSLALRPTRPLQADALGRALSALVAHHDALRLRFRATDEGWSAVHASIDDMSALPMLWTRQLDAASELERLGEEAQRSLDLEHGPLLRAVLAQLADGSQRLLLVIHHLVVDGVSWRVLLEDLQTAYHQLLSGQAVQLPAKTSSYKLWSEKLLSYAETPALRAELDYWQAQLHGAARALPCDHPSGSLQNRYAKTVHTQLSADATKRLLQQAPSAYGTQINDLLLTALARVIGRWTGQASTLIQLEGHGREDLFEAVDLSRTVGWFTAIFPVKLTVSAALGDSIKAVKEQLRAVPNKGIGFGLLQSLQLLHAPARPQIEFNYLGQFDDTFDAEAGLVAPSGESAGPEQSPSAPLEAELSIDGQVYGGALSLGWTFSGQRFEDATIQRLADDYRQELERLIAHCCDEGNAGVTPSDFPLLTVTQAQLDALPIPAQQIEDVYPLSPMQQGMLFHTLYDHESGDYINQVRVDVEGVDIERFRSAWQAAFDAHDVLRTSFLWQGELSQPVQIVHRKLTVPLEVYDWQTQSELSAALDGLAEAERKRGFDLARAPLLRLVLVRTAERRYHLIYTTHHILMDGWGNSQLLGEVVSHYAGQEVDPPAARYRDYIRWLSRQDAAATEAFWKGELAVLEEPTRLVAVAGAAQPEVSGYAEHHQLLSADETRRLSELTRQHKVTANTLVQGAWLLLLQRYTGLDAVACGATVAGRPTDIPGIEQQIGLFINTLPVVVKLRPEQRVSEWLQGLQAKNVRLREHEHTPLYEVQRWAGRGGEALFDTLLVFENYPVSEALEQSAIGELRFENTVLREHTNYPLTVGVNFGEQLALEYYYDRSQLSLQQIERLAGHFQNLLRGIVAHPGKCISELSLLDDAERSLQLAAWNAPVARHARHNDRRYVHQRIEAQAQLRPDAIALLAGDQRLTYRELNEKANRLAHRLIELGVGPEVRVAVATQRSLETIVGFLATLKAGGAYVPLDPDYPADRLHYMLADSGVALLLTQSFLRPKLASADGLEVLCLDHAESYSANASNPRVSLHSENLAYVIYTSGSTGKPKGVTVAHGPLSMHIAALADCYETRETDCELQFMSFAFDGAHEHWLKALTRGARMLLRGAELWTPEELYAVMHRYQTSVTVLPPVYLLQLAQHAEREGNPPRMRIYCFGGDAVPESSFELAKRALRPEHIINGYGPTETVVTPLLWKADRSMACGAAYAPIGRRVGDRTAYVLDADLELQPVGLPGELYLGGYGVARGYHDRPGLTAERFVPDPFSETGERMYRSGDLTRARADGVVDFVGRVDYQVKVRGFRIELGEIEARLAEQAQVREAVVVAHDGPSGKQLVSYVVPRDSHADDARVRDELRSALKSLLPDYMVPSHFVLLRQLPLTPNGKLDRKALPLPEVGTREDSHVEPESMLERQVAAIWSDVLQLTPVSLSDNFFELGGHSLLATQVVSRVKHQLGLEVPLRSVFEAVDLRSFVAAVEGCQSAEQAIPVRADRSVPVALSYAQQRQWFLWQLEPESAAYHMPVALRLYGVLDVAALQRAFVALVARHESLRTTFVQDGERALQVIHATGAVAVERADLTLDALDEAARAQRLRAWLEAEIVRPFDLESGPLLRVKLLRESQDAHVLVLVMHHIVSDGWSMQVMVEELVALYAAESRGTAVELAPLPIQYADYALWQRAFLETGERERQLAYWLQQLGGEQPVLELPSDRPRPPEQSYRGAQLELPLSAELSAALTQLAQREGATLFMVLLASFQALLHRYSGRSDIRVGVPVANRNRVETERLIGFFVNTQVLKAEVDSQKSFRELLQQVKRAVLDAQAYQDLPFEQLVEALQPERSLSYSPLFQVMLNHQTEGQRQTELSLPGLRVTGLSWDTHTAQFDLTLETYESPEGLEASFVYATDLFDAATIQRLAEHWRRLLEGVAATPSARLGALPLLEEAELRQQLVEWNATEVQYPAERCVHTLIEEQAVRTPHAVAVVFGAEQLTYDQLNRRANQLAHRLIALGVGPEVLVGVALERSVELVVGLLAILKAGGAYVPVDPEYPQDRIAYMLQDSGVPLLLTQRDLLEAQVLPVPEGTRVLCLDHSDSYAVAESNPVTRVVGENLAYVIYTSGSTGRPKGAGNRHTALTNRLWWMQRAYGLGAEDAVLQKTPFSFDVSVWEFFWPLFTGARLVVAAPGAHRDPAQLIKVIRAANVTTLHFVPSMLQVFLQDADAARCTSVKRIVCSGEALSVEAQEQVFAKLPQARLYNLYGPTEAAIDVTHFSCEDEGRLSVPIGRPIDNLRVHMVDADLGVGPVGVSGELLIGGVGLARGYHHRAALTAERFIPDPYGEAGGRLYRTGDLARYRPDGVVEYAGRLDHQVKIRGLRIELGEIEARLQERAEVREAVVVAYDGALGKQLVGYVVPAADAELDTEPLRAALKSVLPEYMVPAQLVVLAQLPLTPNGKLDRKALPKPDANASQPTYVEPQTELQKQIAAIWADVLKRERVGLTDNFFELGGHSLLALRVVSELRDKLQRECSLHDFLRAPTVEELELSLSKRTVRASTPLVRLNRCNTSLTPLFCIHPGAGSAYSYTALALQLQAVRPVFGIMSRMLLDPSWTEVSFAEMVQTYTALIVEQQPEGPYLLLGWSLGGKLALSIAAELEKRGRRVGFVGVVDGLSELDAGDPSLAQHVPAEPAHDSAWNRALDFDRQVAVLRVLAPGLDWEPIKQRWLELSGDDASKAYIRAVLKEVAAEREVELEHLENVLADAEARHAIVSGEEVLRRSDELISQFVLQPLRVAPTCWWATLTRGSSTVARLVERLRAHCATGRLSDSIELEVDHEQIVFAPAFIDSAAAKLSASQEPHFTR